MTTELWIFDWLRDLSHIVWEHRPDLEISIRPTTSGFIVAVDDLREGAARRKHSVLLVEQSQSTEHIARYLVRAMEVSEGVATIEEFPAAMGWGGSKVLIGLDETREAV